MMREIQRLAENAGLIFTTNLPYIIFTTPGRRGFINWEMGDWFPGYQFNFRHMKPRATAWIGTHTDALGDRGRSITVHIGDDTLINQYGEIQTSFVSTAPILLDDAEATYNSGSSDFISGTYTDLFLADLNEVIMENAWVASDSATIRHMVEQVHARAIHERENWAANVELPWSPGTRYGIDWYLGDTIVPYLHKQRLLPGVSSMIVRSASIAVRPDGEIRFQAGLGSRADINPAWASQFLKS